MSAHVHVWHVVEGQMGRYVCDCGQHGRRTPAVPVIITCGPRTALEQDEQDPPAWWLDATYFERKAARRIPSILKHPKEYAGC